MRRRLITFLLALVGIGASIAAVLFVLDYLSDPPTASCNAPPAGFGQATTVLTHQEVLVHYTCEGAVQAGTLYLPSKPGPHPAVIWIHGAGPERRLGYAGAMAVSLTPESRCTRTTSAVLASRRGVAVRATTGTSICFRPISPVRSRLSRPCRTCGRTRSGSSARARRDGSHRGPRR